MKRSLIYILLALSATILNSSCNKWLDIQPIDQVSDETLFSDALGFRGALNGIYQQVAAPELYGRELTWGLNSAMGQDYYFFYVPPEYQSALNSLMTDDKLKSIFSKTWAHSYNTIANCNKLIDAVDKKEDSFFLGGRSERNMIKGEALAMRALLHFEMVRLFAKSPANNDAEPVVPYQDVYPAHIAESLTTPVIMQKVIRDLNLAQSLVAEIDTLVNPTHLKGGLSYTLIGSTTAENQLFFTFRMNRLNYVAIHGLLARAYLYAGDIANAKKEARYVYQYGPSGKKWFAFTQDFNTTGTGRYTKFADDLLLAFYDKNLINNVNAYRTEAYNFYLSIYTSVIFPDNERDYRRNLIIQDRNISYKWLETTSAGGFRRAQNTIMPVLRLSEMYYIYSECLFREGNTAEALKILNEARTARGKAFNFEDTSQDGYYGELLMEYRREFMCEGQTIFAHKRLNRPMQIGPLRIEVEGRFTPALPEGER